MKTLLMSLFFSLLISCAYNQNREPKGVMFRNPEVCNQAIISFDQLDFGDVKIGNQSEVQSIVVESSENVQVKNINIYGIQDPFLFGPGGGHVFGDNKNCKSISNITRCEIELIVQPISVGVYTDDIIVNFKANNETCSYKIQLIGTGVKQI